MGKRRKAREIVLDLLYFYEVSAEDENTLLGQIKKEKQTDKKTKDYAKRLLLSTLKNLELIDGKLQKTIDNWNFNRVAIIDKCILRFAVAEMLFLPDIPIKVSIDEAVEIAKHFSTEQSGAFVNGILDEIAHSENLL